MKTKERFQALSILKKTIEKKIPLTHLLGETKTSGLTKALCFGICRHYFRLECIADILLKKRPKDLDIWLTVLMGLYQIEYMRIPDFAAVQESVSLTNEIGKPWAKGLINALLRRFCREKDIIIKQVKDNKCYQHNHPSWFVKVLKKSWPKEYQKILSANDAHPPMHLRVNLQKCSAQEYLSLLDQAGIKAEPLPLSEAGIVLETPCDVDKLPKFEAGFVSVQDCAAQLASSLLGLAKGMHILDACAAPGGKTAHIIESTGNASLVTAIDIDSNRVKRIQENLSRLGLNAQVICADATQPSNWWDGKLFDRILLDAPCSATGVIRRHPDIKVLRQKSDIEPIVKQQKQLLQTLWPLLAPGGSLLYATCSVIPDENSMQIRQFIDSYPDCKLIQNQQNWCSHYDFGYQILPGEYDQDGFFYAILQKQS